MFTLTLTSGLSSAIQKCCPALHHAQTQISEIVALGELAADARLSRCVSTTASAQKLFPEADPLVFPSEQHRREVGLLKTQPGFISKPNIPFQL